MSAHTFPRQFIGCVTTNAPKMSEPRHRAYRTRMCRHYPDCWAGDECAFYHPSPKSVACVAIQCDLTPTPRYDDPADLPPPPPEFLDAPTVPAPRKQPPVPAPRPRKPQPSSQPPPLPAVAKKTHLLEVPTTNAASWVINHAEETTMREGVEYNTRARACLFGEEIERKRLDTRQIIIKFNCAVCDGTFSVLAHRGHKGGEHAILAGLNTHTSSQKHTRAAQVAAIRARRTLKL
jgi:hypothetical protein